MKRTFQVWKILKFRWRSSWWHENVNFSECLLHSLPFSSLFLSGWKDFSCVSSGILKLLNSKNRKIWTYRPSNSVQFNMISSLMVSTQLKHLYQLKLSFPTKWDKRSNSTLIHNPNSAISTSPFNPQTVSSSWVSLSNSLGSGRGSIWLGFGNTLPREQNSNMAKATSSPKCHLGGDILVLRRVSFWFKWEL